VVEIVIKEKTHAGPEDKEQGDDLDEKLTVHGKGNIDNNAWYFNPYSPLGSKGLTVAGL